MNKKDSLESLPINYRNEKDFLLKNHLSSWEKLSNLSNYEIYEIIKNNPLCTESRLRKIKSIAKFIVHLQIPPHQAYLLLHCGISSFKALSTINPHNLEKKIGRLERNLRFNSKVSINLIIVKEWIVKAQNLS